MSDPAELGDLSIREAVAADLKAVVRLFQADSVGGHGDAWTAENQEAYEAAFRAIQASPATALFVAERDRAVVATFQVILSPGIAGRGALRAKLEGVQVDAALRSQGIGARMLAFAEAWARAKGAASLALTSNKRRADAHRFYERHGYARSHEGFSKRL